jgi:hypothetical protein
MYRGRRRRSRMVGGREGGGGGGGGGGISGCNYVTSGHLTDVTSGHVTSGDVLSGDVTSGSTHFPIYDGLQILNTVEVVPKTKKNGLSVFKI